jgi:uncharacterized protein
MNKIISDNYENIKAICRVHNVNKLYAFGSICTNSFNDMNDIDFLISFKHMDYGDYADTYFNLAEKFENLLKRPVDLITENSLSNPYFIDSINKTRKLIYE